MVLQPDGKIVAAGRGGPISRYAVVRYNSDGGLDTSFDGDGITTVDPSGGGGTAWGVALQADGKIVVAGQDWNGALGYDFGVARLNTNGSLDTTFSGDGLLTTNIFGGDDSAFDVVVQADGKIVVAGEDRPTNDFAVVRYNADGSLDTSFSADGIVTTDIAGSQDFGYGVAVQADGKILVTGYAFVLGTEGDFALVRYASDGSLDTSFDGDGIVTVDAGVSDQDEARAVAVQSDGKIVVAGTMAAWGTSGDFAVMRFYSDGSLDDGHCP
jgi:uncharacterized delta-60 repeat protein